MSPAVAVAVALSVALVASPAAAQSGARRSTKPASTDPSSKVPLPPAPDLKAHAPRLLVLDFAVKGGGPADLGRTVADAAAREATAAGGFEVLARPDVLARLGAEQQRVLKGCVAEGPCLTSVAGVVGADRAVTGTVTKLDDGYTVSAKLVDARKLAVLGSAEETVWSPRADDAVAAARRVVFRVVTAEYRPEEPARAEQAAKPEPASLEFDVRDVAARVVLDGKEIGRGPFQDVRKVEAGSHRVAVAKDGHATWERVYQLEPGGRAQIVPQLERPTSPRKAGGNKILGWSAIGTGAAALALGGVAIWQESVSRSEHADARDMRASPYFPGTSNPAYQDAVSSGDRAHRNAVAFGVGAGVAAATSVVLGYLSYRQTGEIGPFRF